MKKLLFIIVLITFLVPSTKATHIVGGELNYLYLGNDNYEIRLTVYRDCLNGSPFAPFDPFAAVGIFDVNNVLLDTLKIPFIYADTLTHTLPSPCIDTNVNVCYEVTTYIDTINLPPIPGGYQLSYQRCCRNETIKNIVSPLTTGATYYATIPDTVIEVVNSNPVFNSWPPTFICSQLPFSFDHSATDPEGDSLYYELFVPDSGGAWFVCGILPQPCGPMPQPPNNPPYDTLTWQAPYSTADMLGTTLPLSVPLAIDPTTGLLTAVPDSVGQFVVGIKVSEYRNGIFLSETRRDYQFNVEPCVNYTVAALIAPNFSCESFTATFSNNSSGAGTYLWDFGDPASGINNTSTDSTPIHLYSDTGTFNVMLIAFSSFNPACNDTTFGTVIILPEFGLTMSSLNEPCTQGVMFGSVSSLDSTGNVVFDWDFGNGTGTSSLQNPNYTYPDTGTYTVTLIAYSPINTGCNDTTTLTITIFPEFTLGSFFVDIPCSPDISFTGSSSFDGLFPVNYFWDFGVQTILSDTSNISNPNYTYPASGTYTPTLIAYVDSPSCGDTSQLQVVIYPDFIFNYTINDIRCTYGVEFTASSSLDGIVGTSYSWSFGDGMSSTTQIDTHFYAGSGNYDITLTINTSNGCIDSYSTTLEKAALAEVFVPNAFTPNGDNENDLLYVRGGLDEMSIKIYNRWGELVFETTDQSVGWDGTFKGNLVDPGVFVYHLITKCADTDEIFKKGNITVIR